MGQKMQFFGCHYADLSFEKYCLPFFNCSVLCKYANTAFLEVKFKSTVLGPGQSANVDILFYPREYKDYHEVIPFEINGLSTITVDVFGQGTEIKVW